MRKLSLWLLTMIALASQVAAATVSGVVYDLSLHPVAGAIVELSDPEQRFVAVNGSYSFNVGAGTFVLKATQVRDGIVTAATEDAITVTGDAHLDLILFPTLDEEDSLLNESDIEAAIADEPSFPWWLVGVGVTLVMGGVALWLMHRARTPVTSASQTSIAPDLQRILEFIKSQGGRTTQKDVRAQFPESEAKISLMLAELEGKGLVRKIKQGRGNIITLP